jgi:hypothetical protein
MLQIIPGIPIQWVNDFDSVTSYTSLHDTWKEYKHIKYEYQACGPLEGNSQKGQRTNKPR